MNTTQLNHVGRRTPVRVSFVNSQYAFQKRFFMSAFAQRLKNRFYAGAIHPYSEFERQVNLLLQPESILLDAGCGRTAPVLRSYIGRASRLIGIELVEFTDVPPEIECFNSDLAHIPLPDGTVDLIMSRSVFEHLAEPASVYREFSRVLRPGGHVVFLTANVWDYATLAAKLVPNRFHGRIVARIEGRAEEDVFPTQYKTNSRSEINYLCNGTGLSIVRFDYLSQYPNYFMFNGMLFLFATAYEKLISRFDALAFLRGWILVTLRKSG